MNMKLSHNGRYLMYGNILNDLLTNESHKIDNLPLKFWIQFLKENTINGYKNGIKDLSELNNFIRETVYNISKEFSGRNRDSFILEYELRHSNILLKEGVDDLTKNIENIWGFIDQKINHEGLYEQEQSLLDRVKSGLQKTVDYVKQKGIPFVMENLREALFSWGGAAVQTALATIGAPFGGTAVLYVIWGAMLAYDVYEAIQGRPNYFNILIDIISIATFGVGGKIASTLFRQIGVASGAITRNLPQMLTKISASSGGAWFAGIIRTVGSKIGSILSFMGKGITWVGTNLGVSTLKNSGSRLTKWVSDFISKLGKSPIITNKLTPTVATGALVAGVNKLTGASNQTFSGAFTNRGDEILARSTGDTGDNDYAIEVNIDTDYPDIQP